MASALACLLYLAGLAAVTVGVLLVEPWLGLVVGGSLLSASALGFFVLIRVRASLVGQRGPA